MIPTRLGQVVEGCMFVGINHIGRQTYAIFLAPRSTETELQQKTSNSSTLGTQSVIDGFANTHAMNNPDHPAAQYCASLTVNGQGDFYLPSRNELELCFRTLKPTNLSNFTYSADRARGNLPLASGSNNSSIPTGAPYTQHSPDLTIIVNTSFNFIPEYHWTSTEASLDFGDSLIQSFVSGHQGRNDKTTEYMVRAVRRQLIVEI